MGRYKSFQVFSDTNTKIVDVPAATFAAVPSATSAGAVSSSSAHGSSNAIVSNTAHAQGEGINFGGSESLGPFGNTGAEGGVGGGQAKPRFEKLRNIKGSTAGADSSCFDRYRETRKSELERLARMDEEDRLAKEKKAYLEKVSQNKKETEERTEKNREKRLKKKRKAAELKQMHQQRLKVGSNGTLNDDAEGSGSESNEELGLKQDAIDPSRNQ